VCLAWGTSERFKGCLSQNAAIVFIMTSMAFGSDVVGSLHFGAKDNTVCDGLSRDKISPRDICEREDQILDLQNDPVIQRLYGSVIPLGTCWRRSRTGTIDILAPSYADSGGRSRRESTPSTARTGSSPGGWDQWWSRRSERQEWARPRETEVTRGTLPGD